MAGTLSLAPLPPEDPTRIQQMFEAAAQDAIRQLKSQGIDTPGPPKGYRGEMPDNLHEMDDNEIGDLLNKLSAWCGFLDVKLAEAAGMRATGEKAVASIKGTIRVQLRADEDGRKLTGPDKDDRVTSDPRVVEAERREIFSYTYFMLLKGVRDEAQRNWETVSRRITQRGQEVQRQVRELNAGAVGNAPVVGRRFMRRG